MAPAPTLPSKSLPPLATFAHNWVGGDIHGLAAFASTLYGYVPGMEDVVTALNKRVNQIVSDASWQGSAAQAFTDNWEKVSAEVNAVGLVVIQTRNIVDQLAVNLAAIENALESAASQAAAHGVQIGASGQPPGVSYANATQESWRVAYSDFYQQCLADANAARVQAAGDLVALTSTATGGGSSGLATGVGEGNTIGNLVADLLATKTAYARRVAEKVEKAKDTLTKADDAFEVARRKTRGGRLVKVPRNLKLAKNKAEGELASVEAELDKAQGDEGNISKLFGTRARDLPGLGKAAATLNEDGLLFKAADLPVVDVVAGGIGTVLNAQSDTQAGVPGWAAYPLETVNTVGTIALASLVGTGVAGAAVFAGVPALGVATGVAAASVVAYGVGDYVHNFIADMPQQWDQHGALGVVTDFGAAGVSTWNDTTHLASDIGGAASSAWHGITSFF